MTAAIWSMSRPDVLVARIAPGLAIASSFLKISCFSEISSNTASMMRSASASAQTHALVHRRLVETAARNSSRIIVAYAIDAAVKRLLRNIE